MNPEFYSFQMSITAGRDAGDVVFAVGRFGRSYTQLPLLHVLLTLALLSNEENQ